MRGINEYDQYDAVRCRAHPTDELVNVTDSLVRRWGAGIVQEIEAAAMHEVH